MPTTRSSKQPTEAFHTLETPKRGRKNTKNIRTKKQSPSPSPVRIYLASTRATQTSPLPGPERPRYVSVGTQTLPVTVLTHYRAAATEERAMTTTQKKRNRDEESEDEPQSKRMMFTPQPNPDRTLWMFPAVDAPRTAPAKSSIPSHRPRGKISQTPRYRRSHMQGTSSRLSSTPYQISPIDVEPSDRRSDDETHDKLNEARNVPQSQTPTRPSSRGIFGSLRGLAATGLQFAMNLSPRKPNSQVSPDSSNSPQQQSSHQQAPNVDDQEGVQRSDTVTNKRTTTNSTGGREADRSKSPDEDPLYPTIPSRYDHLHFIPAGGDAAQRAYNGDSVHSPHAQAPVNFYDSLKQNHPEATEGWLRRMADQKRRRLEETTGIDPDAPPPMTAPLFGPDSHYTRGTVDPAWLRPEPWKDSIQRKDEEEQRQNKRKLSEVDDGNEDHIAGNTIDRENPAEHDFEGDNNTMEDVTEVHTPLAKKQRTMLPSTPRSALRKPSEFGTSMGRSGGRSVLFNENPVSDSRGLRAHYGPAGQYRGSTFADKSPPSRNEDSTLSSFEYDDVISPSTKFNTFTNSTSRSITKSSTQSNSISTSRYDNMVQLEKNLGADIPHIDFTLRDPQNPEWRPSVTNPRPGSFRVPYLDEEDEDMDESQDVVGEKDSTPEQPSTPRMSHAELPTPATSSQSDIRQSIETGSAFEPTEQAIQKARSQAQKYKPKDSSRLSSVSQAISRSPSPEQEMSEESTHMKTTTTTKTTAPAVRPLGAPPQPFVEPELDNTIRDPKDGLTAHEREHQYDEWAANLNWPEPQIYEDAGTGSKQIHDLIRKNWTTEDSRRSSEFWNKEFDELNLAMEAAQKQGLRLELVTGMEDTYGTDALMSEAVY